MDNKIIAICIFCFATGFIMWFFGNMMYGEKGYIENITTENITNETFPNVTWSYEKCMNYSNNSYGRKEKWDYAMSQEEITYRYHGCVETVENYEVNISEIDIIENTLNNTFVPKEYIHPLEGQIVKWYHSEDEKSTQTAIPEFGSVLIPMLLMLVSLGRVRI